MKIKGFDMNIESLRNEDVIMGHQLPFRLNIPFSNHLRIKTYNWPVIFPCELWH